MGTSTTSLFAITVASFSFATSALALDLPAPLSEDDFFEFDAKRAELGQLLFYDKILSGNRNISCGTCHHHELGSADGLSLGMGEGGTGLGAQRVNGAGSDGIHERVPRNAPALWNLAHRDIDKVFHDGRLSVDASHPSGFKAPSGDDTPIGIETLLAAQALFPPTSHTEMAGQPGENEVANASAVGMHRVWPILAARVAAIPEYEQMFVASFDHVDSADDITMVEIVNAIAAFVGTEFRNYDSPFDAYLAGETAALNDQQMRGMEMFFGEVGCSSCHAGPLLSDQEFHAIGLPQIGPGRAPSYDPMQRDVGLMAMTQDLSDAYRFKTPFLRNVALTGPYGHNGAMPTLEDMVRHHVNPVASRIKWTADMAILPEAEGIKADFVLLGDQLEMDREMKALDIDLPAISESDIADIVAFLHALTGETAESRPMGVPVSVPSGLPVD